MCYESKSAPLHPSLILPLSQDYGMPFSNIIQAPFQYRNQRIFLHTQQPCHCSDDLLYWSLPKIPSRFYRRTSQSVPLGFWPTHLAFHTFCMVFLREYYIGQSFWFVTPLSPFLLSINIIDNHHLWDLSTDHSQWTNDVVNLLTQAYQHAELPSHRDVVCSLVILPDDDMQTFNARFRGKNTPTNVLAFPNQEKSNLWSASFIDNPIDLGDIILGWNTMHAEARHQHKQPFHHTMHLILHGFLHLLHFDHQTDDQAHEMETIEQALFARNQWPNPYLSSFVMD